MGLWGDTVTPELRLGGCGGGAEVCGGLGREEMGAWSHTKKVEPWRKE